MKQVVLPRHLLRFISLVLFFIVISLTITPLCDTLADQGSTEDKGAEMVLRHMTIMVEKKPEIAQKRQQVQEELNNGTLTPKAACLRCHTPAQGGP